MGVDYSAEFGIGFEVEFLEGYEEENMEEYLNLQLPEAFAWWRSGSAYRREKEYYVGVEGFVNGDSLAHIDWRRVERELLEVLDTLSLKAVSDFGVVGGVYVY